MNFHTFGNKQNKTMVLIHGLFHPWQIWEPIIDHYSKSYYVIVPELDSHTQDAPTEFISAEQEAEQIKAYLLDNVGGQVFALCGVNMGGRIAAILAGIPELNIENLVLDGALLSSSPRFVRAFVKKLFGVMLDQTRAGNQSAIDSIKKEMVPERCINECLKVIENLSKGSLNNIIDSCYSKFKITEYNSSMNILYMHGTKPNESYAKKAAHKLKQKKPQAKLRMCEGMGQAELLGYQERKWIAEVNNFLA